MRTVGKISFLISLFLITSYAYTEQIIFSYRNGIKKVTSYQVGGDRKIAILYTKNSDKLLILCTGYTPNNDIFHQSPTFFVKNWDLKSFQLNILIVNFGTSVYYKEDTKKLVEIIKKAIDITKAKTVYCIGVSTGVEGCIKTFFTLEETYKKLFKRFLFISGTYDLSILPKNSGEAKIHNISQEILLTENPINFIWALTNKEVFFVTEKNSIYYHQLTNIHKLYGTYNNFHFLYYEKYYHDWNFWKSKEVLYLLSSFLHEEDNSHN